MSRFPQLVAASFGLVAAVSAQNVEEQLSEIRERLDEIEELQIETTDKVGGRAVVQAFSGVKSFDFGGHVTSLFTHIEGENGSDTGHMVSLVELFLKADVDEQWSLFATPGFYTFNGALLDNPATPTVAGDPTFSADNAATENIFVSRIYAQWKPNDQLQVQGGVVGSPHGPTNRTYFLPSRTIAQANLHTRIFLANQLYPQNLRGVKASGKYTIGDADWVEYDAYFGSQDTNAGDGIGGARIGYTFGELGLNVAANFGRGTRTATTVPTTNFGILQSPFTGAPFVTRDYQFGGLDVELRKGAFVFKGEAYYSAEENFVDQRALSAEFNYFVTPEWGVAYRYDFYDAGSDLNPFLPTPAVLPLGHSTEHVIGVNYNPHPSVRLRLDLHHNNLPNTGNTVQYANVSWSISF